MCKTHLPPSSSSGRFGRYIVVFLIAMPVKRGLVAPQNIFIQTIIKKFDGSRKSVKLLSHIDGSIFYFCKKRSASTTPYNSKVLFLIHNAFIADRNFVLGNAQVADLPIIYCNDGFCELTGYSRAELVQKHCSCDFLCGENTNEFSAKEVKEALRGHEEKHVEILYYRKDGKIKSITIILAFLNTNLVCNEQRTQNMCAVVL